MNTGALAIITAVVAWRVGYPFWKRRRSLGCLITCIAALLWAGHTMGRSRLTYPFHRWDMYSTSEAPQQYYQFRAFTADGQVQDFPFDLINPWSPGPLRGYSMLAPLSMRLIARQSRCKCASNDQELDKLIDAMAVLFERRRGVPLRAFEITSRLATVPSLDHAKGLTLYSWP